MHKFKNYTLAVIGVLALALSVTLVTTKRAGAQQTEAIARPPAKPASPVEVVNVPTVFIAGTPLAVFDIDNARQPVQSGNAAFAAQNGHTTSSTDTLHVPNNKRLVIEQVTAQGFSPNGRIVSVGVTTWVNGVPADHYLVLNDAGVSAGGFFYQTVSQQVKFYADPNTDVRAFFERNDNRNNTSMFIQVSGYFVDVAQFQDMGR
jgi:hypothetical protein